VQNPVNLRSSFIHAAPPRVSRAHVCDVPDPLENSLGHSNPSGARKISSATSLVLFDVCSRRVRAWHGTHSADGERERERERGRGGESTVSNYVYFGDDSSGGPFLWISLPIPCTSFLHFFLHIKYLEYFLPSSLRRPVTTHPNPPLKESCSSLRVESRRIN